MVNASTIGWDDQTHRKTNASMLVIFFFVTAFSICHIIFAPSLIDDAYIGFRIAKNFAAGNGLVYNAHEHIMTSTTTLYVLMNGILWKMLGDHTIISILLLNVFWHAMTACFLFRFVRQSLMDAGPTPISVWICSLFAALFFVLSGAVSIVATCGMETPFYTFFICLSFYLLFINKLSWSVLVSTVPFLIRPEGFLVSFVIMFFILIEKRKVDLKHVCIILSVVIPYLLALSFYYGSIFPQSIPAKSLYSINRLQEIKEFGLTYFFTLKRLPLGFLFFSGLYYCISRNCRLLPFIVWGLLYACFFTLLASWWKWYKPPFYMVYSCVTALGISFWVEWLRSRYPSRKGLTYSPCLVAILLLVAASVNERKMITEDSMIYQGFLAGAKRIADVILRNTGKDQFVTLEPLGFIGFYAFERNFKDYPGLCSPEVVGSLKHLGRKLNGTLSDYEALRQLNNDIKPSIFVLRRREYEINRENGTIKNYRVIDVVPIEFQGTRYFEEVGEGTYYVLERIGSLSQEN